MRASDASIVFGNFGCSGVISSAVVISVVLSMRRLLSDQC
jgi:hypothetical protein